MHFDAFMEFFYFLWIRDQKSLVSVVRFFQSSLSGHQTNVTLDVNIAWISRALAHKVRHRHSRVDFSHGFAGS